MVGTEREYSQTTKKTRINKSENPSRNENSKPKKTNTILSCNNVQEVSLKLLTLPEHVANSTRHVAKAVAKGNFASTSYTLLAKSHTNRNK